MKTWLSLIIGATLMTTSTFAAAAYVEDPNVTKAKAAVCEKLLDCHSAYWKVLNVKLSSNGNPAIICGKVNARASDGHYSGYARFIYVMEKKNDPDHVVMLDDGDAQTAAIDNSWAKECGLVQ